MFWLLILFSFPLLGSLVYFGQARLAGQALQKKRDPDREVREARAAFNLTPTAHNQMRLAAALLDSGQTAQYDACLQGPFAGDAGVILGAARAKVAHGQPAEAIRLLAPLQQRQPGYRPEQVGLVLGRAHAASGQQEQAGAQFMSVAERFGSIEARVELALWALANRDEAVAQRELKEIEHARRHMTQYTLDTHRDLFRRLDAAAGGR
ncbi:hypothetical protein [Massilia sp. MS-15]|uniref:hypothetical protein n=1 Tax=Massilia sp. MS-15 TaxID=2878200 RepID=UPI001CD6F456|nr:hypothetical protein [Massilia sp. MS-15]MCA1248674.1 hypothetical protein [Massilia sp. MS-15]